MTDLADIRAAITDAMEERGWPRAPLDLGGTEYGAPVRRALDVGCEALSFHRAEVDRTITLLIGPEMTVIPEPEPWAARFVTQLLDSHMGEPASTAVN